MHTHLAKKLEGQKSMRAELKSLLTSRVYRYGFILSIVFILSGFSFLLIKVWSLPPVVPLFYQRPWGQSQLGAPMQLFFLLLGALLVFGVNLSLSIKIHRTSALLCRILLWVSVLTSFLAATAVVRIILLVT